MKTVTTRITALGQRGEGVAEIEGQRVYVPFTLPNEQVEITYAEDRGTLLQLENASPHRIVPFCPYFGECGGCQIQHLDAASYSAFKRSLVENALSHAGVDVPVEALVEAHGAGRRRATLHVRGAGAGYMRARSHDLLDIDHCPILVPSLQATAPALARRLHKVVGDCDVSFTATVSGLDIAVRSEKAFKPERLVPLAQTLDFARLSINGELVLQRLAPRIAMGRAEVELPVGSSFLQATELAEKTLASLVLKPLKGKKQVADLFCGLGPFALRIAERAPVYAADTDKPAVTALAQAARHTQGLKQISPERRDLFREPLTRFELNRFDAVVLDPPRAGAEAQVRELAQTKIPTLVYVSCEPKSFARDAAILLSSGYTLASVTPVDQFAWSTHVELVGTFERR